MNMACSTCKRTELTEDLSVSKYCNQSERNILIRSSTCFLTDTKCPSNSICKQSNISTPHARYPENRSSVVPEQSTEH